MKILFNAGLLIAFFFINAAAFSQEERYAFKNEKGLYGFRNIKDKVKIKPQFDAVSEWNSNICGVKQNGKWGYIDREGELVIPYQYDSVAGMIVTLEGKKGMIDKTGKLFLPINYTYLEESYPLFIASMDNLKFGFIDSSAKVVIPMVYDECRKFDHEIIIQKRDTGYKWIEPTRLAAVKLNGSWGFIDKRNRFFVPPIYKAVQDFKNNLTWVSMNGIAFGAIGRSGKLFVPFSFTNPGEWNSQNYASATYGSAAGRVSSNAVFTSDRTGTIQLKLNSSFPKAAEPMMQSALQAEKNGYPKEAIQWYIKAYNNGSGEAAKILGDIYKRDTTKKSNRALAVEWYRKGAAAGDLVCMVEMSDMYQDGIYLPQNDTLSFTILKQLAALLNGYDLDKDFGDDDEYEFIIRGLSELADHYTAGIVTPKDPVQAFYWHKKAADAGDYYSSLMTGHAYYNGQGISKNIANAVNYYLYAAEEYDDAMYAVGTIWYKGEEKVPQKKEEAVKWLKAAANNGHKKSIEFLKKEGIK